jgi:hypothetical protein
VGVVEIFSTFPHHIRKMELTYSFPPADNLIQQLSKIEYKKHLNNYMDIVETVVMLVAAVCYVLFEKFVEWYQNGGKESTIQTVQKVWNILQVCYTWSAPKVMQFLKSVHETYKNWSDLVTVA